MDEADENPERKAKSVPLEEWGLDPLFCSYRKILIRTIKDLVVVQEKSGVFQLLLHGRGISKVEIVGIVVSVTARANKIVYHVDDGTAVMRCMKFLSTDSVGGAQCLQHVGDLVSVKGALIRSETNDEPYGFAMHINYIEALSDPNLELFHWLMSVDLYKQHYSRNSST